MATVRCDVDFGQGYGGIATVGYTVYGFDGSTLVARTTSGITDRGNGVYQATVTIPDGSIGTIIWDTYVNSPVHAIEHINVTEPGVIADTILRRNMANVEVSSNGDVLNMSSLYGAIQMMQESNTVTNPGYLTVYRTDGVTEVGRKLLAYDANAIPITGVS
jgi:hypothetical protein